MVDTYRLKTKELSVADSENIRTVKLKAAELDDFLTGIAVPSREISLAKTKLEEAVMWAVKGLTND